MNLLICAERSLCVNSCLTGWLRDAGRLQVCALMYDFFVGMLSEKNDLFTLFVCLYDPHLPLALTGSFSSIRPHLSCRAACGKIRRISLCNSATCWSPVSSSLSFTSKL